MNIADPIGALAKQIKSTGPMMPASKPGDDWAFCGEDWRACPDVDTGFVGLFRKEGGMAVIGMSRADYDAFVEAMKKL
jgi:hypothetical protein